MSANPLGTSAGLVYHWIAEYAMGECLPQFDHDTGEEFRFRDIRGAELLCLNCRAERDFAAGGLARCLRCGGMKFRTTVERGTLKSFGWYPMTEQIAKHINERNPDLNAVATLHLPSYKLDLKLDQWLIAYRKASMTIGTNKTLDNFQLGRPYLNAHQGTPQESLFLERKHGFDATFVPHKVEAYVIGYVDSQGREKVVALDWRGEVVSIER